MLFPDCRAPRLDGLRHATRPWRGLNLEKSLMNLPINQKKAADLASCSWNVEKNRLGALEWAQQSATFDIIDAWPILKNRSGLRFWWHWHCNPSSTHHSIIIFAATCFTWTKIRDAFHCHILFVRGPADSRAGNLTWLESPKLFKRFYICYCIWANPNNSQIWNLGFLKAILG